MISKTFSICGVALALLSTGCATIITGAGPDQKVRIASEPRGASVYIDGQYKGITPTSVPLTRKDHHALRLELVGFANFEKEIESGFNAWFLGNILFGGIIGIVVDAVDGAITGLSPNDLTAKLIPNSPPLQR